MVVGYYPHWEQGFVRDYLMGLENRVDRRKAAAKLRFDIQMLATEWPRPKFVRVKKLRGYESLWELMREYEGISYRVFFCVSDDEMWLLHAIEKKSQKTPLSDLELAFKRMHDIFRRKDE